eukprot:gene18372-42450_t
MRNARYTIFVVLAALLIGCLMPALGSLVRGNALLPAVDRIVRLVYGAARSVGEPWVSSSVDADEVAPGVFLGSLRAASNRAFLRSRNITRVVLAVAGAMPAFPLDHELAYLVVPAHDRDDQDLAPYFDAVSAFVRPGTLVHCMRGRSRSAALVLQQNMSRSGYEQLPTADCDPPPLATPQQGAGAYTPGETPGHSPAGPDIGAPLRLPPKAVKDPEGSHLRRRDPRRRWLPEGPALVESRHASRKSLHSR